MALDLGARRLIAVVWATLACLLAALPARAAGAPIGTGAPPPLLWRGATASPDALVGAEARDPLYEICGAPDASLRAVSARNAARLARGEASLPADELTFALRASGLPYVWPRAWSMRGQSLEPEKVAAELKRFVEKSPALGERRCGVARIEREDGAQVVSAVVVDVLADLDPVPTITRVGSWITVRGRMLVPASETKVVLLGPHGPPRTVLASLSGGELRASFSVDQPGLWIVQVLASAQTGPRPVLEAHVAAGVDPPLYFAQSAAPGEEAAASSTTDVGSLRAMIDAARATEKLPSFSRDPVLDRLAEEHSKRMRDQRAVGHDVGDGDIIDRLDEAGVTYQSRGENVAAASSTVRAHRALWSSPSHRSNLLDARFTRMGLGIAKGDDGRVFVTEIFVD